MGKEINLLENYPKSNRNLEERKQDKSEESRFIARQFGKEFFDGDRKNGYGGFSYNPRFWTPVIPKFISYWNLTSEKSVLDVGCAKGFMIYDMLKAIPKIKIEGIDISEYAINNALPEVKSLVKVANADNLPFEDNSFDVVISINTIHNLNEEGCAKALKEIERVSKENSFVTVDAYSNDEEKKRMLDWNLTAKTIFSVEDWKLFFKKTGYTGDYYWFIP